MSNMSGSNLWPFSRRGRLYPLSNRPRWPHTLKSTRLIASHISHWNDQLGVTFSSCVCCQATLSFFRLWQVAIYSLQTQALFSITWIWLLNSSFQDNLYTQYILSKVLHALIVLRGGDAATLSHTNSNWLKLQHYWLSLNLVPTSAVF